MKITRLLLTVVLLTLGFAISAVAQVNPNVYTLRPSKLSNGWVVTGTITTDGTVGYFSSLNIVDWNLKVVQTTDIVWTETNSSAANIAGVYTDGTKIHVPTSPDGVLDGGSLNFTTGAGGGAIPTAAYIADFTQLSSNLGYAMGGVAGWQSELGGLNYLGLNKPMNKQYHAATVDATQANLFHINVPAISTTPLMRLFGTITTDGTIGPLAPQNFVAWNITGRTQDITFYTKANSTVLFVAGVSSDGTSIFVDHAAGQFVIGIPGRRPTFVTLADFTDPTMPNGFANYYMGNFGVMGDRTPLLGAKAKTYTVAKK